MQYADDGFGNMIPVNPAPEPRPEIEACTWVFARMGDGRLARWRVGTADHHLAINALRGELDARIKPVLAMIEGGKL